MIGKVREEDFIEPCRGPRVWCKAGCGTIILSCAYCAHSGRHNMRLRDTAETASFDTASRSEGSFLPRLRPVRVPATRDDLRHNCTKPTSCPSRVWSFSVVLSLDVHIKETE